MKKSLLYFAAVASAAWLMVVLGCSSDDEKTPTDSGGGTQREFVSGDLNNGESYTHAFTSAKAIPYYCRYHGAAGGVGMAGVVTVTAGGTPSSHAVSITNNTLPTMTIDIMDTITWTNNSGVLHTVESDS